MKKQRHNPAHQIATTRAKDGCGNREPLAKTPTGIEGFDELTAGGLPRGRTTLLMGGAGCGKTVLALQILVNGAIRQDTAGIFVTFEENARAVAANGESFGWEMRELEKKHLFFLDAKIS